MDPSCGQLSASFLILLTCTYKTSKYSLHRHVGQPLSSNTFPNSQKIRQTGPHLGSVGFGATVGVGRGSMEQKRKCFIMKLYPSFGDRNPALVLWKNSNRLEHGNHLTSQEINQSVAGLLKDGFYLMQSLSIPKD